jgi:photosystem II stability/assembly factor-like uncharacterized protein
MKKIFLILALSLLSCNDSKKPNNNIKSVDDVSLDKNEIMLDISFSEDYTSVWVRVLDTVNEQEYYKVWMVEKKWKKSLEDKK